MRRMFLVLLALLLSACSAPFGAQTCAQTAGPLRTTAHSKPYGLGGGAGGLMQSSGGGGRCRKS